MKITETNFIQQLKRNNPQAIEYIAAQYGGLIKAVLVKNLGNQRDCWEECFNDVLLALWNNPQSFDEEKEAKFSSWLCAIAKHKAIDLLRREKHNLHLVSFEEAKGQMEYNGYEEAFEKEDSGDEELDRLLSCLCEEDKDLFFRRYVREESMVQITEETGINRDLVYARISRGKKKIRRNLERDRGNL